jgi:hypothetical protein
LHDVLLCDVLFKSEAPDALGDSWLENSKLVDKSSSACAAAAAAAPPTSCSTDAAL